MSGSMKGLDEFGELHKKVEKLEKELAELEAENSELVNDLRAEKGAAGRWCNRAQEAEGGIIDLKKWLREEIAVIENNDVYKQPAALIQINAPVALIQVELKARRHALMETLEKL